MPHDMPFAEKDAVQPIAAHVDVQTPSSSGGISALLAPGPPSYMRHAGPRGQLASLGPGGIMHFKVDH